MTTERVTAETKGTVYSSQEESSSGRPSEKEQSGLNVPEHLRRLLIPLNSQAIPLNIAIPPRRSHIPQNGRFPHGGGSTGEGVGAGEDTTPPRRCIFVPAIVSENGKGEGGGEVTFPSLPFRLHQAADYKALRIGEASKIIHRKVKTVRRLYEQGKFPSAYKTKGGHLRIPAYDLTTWLHNNEEDDERKAETDDSNDVLGNEKQSGQAAGAQKSSEQGIGDYALLIYGVYPLPVPKSLREKTYGRVSQGKALYRQLMDGNLREWIVLTHKRELPPGDLLHWAAFTTLAVFDPDSRGWTFTTTAQSLDRISAFILRHFPPERIHYLVLLTGAGDWVLYRCHYT